MRELQSLTWRKERHKFKRIFIFTHLSKKQKSNSFKGWKSKAGVSILAHGPLSAHTSSNCSLQLTVSMKFILSKHIFVLFFSEVCGDTVPGEPRRCSSWPESRAELQSRSAEPPGGVFSWLPWPLTSWWSSGRETRVLLVATWPDTDQAYAMLPVETVKPGLGEVRTMCRCLWKGEITVCGMICSVRREWYHKSSSQTRPTVGITNKMLKGLILSNHISIKLLRFDSKSLFIQYTHPMYSKYKTHSPKCLGIH